MTETGVFFGSENENSEIAGRSVIDISNHEVVRQEYVFTQDVPVLTLKMGRIYVNKYAINLFPDHSYIQIYVDREKEDIVLQPVRAGVKDSFRWCGGTKRNPRKLKCLPVFYELFQQMDWDVSCRYCIKGREEMVSGNGEEEDRALYFSLKDATCFRKEDGREYPEFPKEWEGSFGTRKSEHKDDGFIMRLEEDRIFSIELPIDQRNMQKMENAVKQ